MHDIYQHKMYPFSKHLAFEYRFLCRVDNAACPHDGCADSQCLQYLYGHGTKCAKRTEAGPKAQLRARL